MKLAFKDHPMKLANVNVRAEMNGEEREPASDLKFEVDAPNDILSMLREDLKPALYRFDKDRADLADAGKKEAGFAPHLKFPKLSGPLRWDDEMAGCAISIREKGAKSYTTLEDVKVNNVEFTPKDGGTVSLRFRVQCHPEEKTFGKLATLVQSEVEVTLQAAG